MGGAALDSTSGHGTEGPSAERTGTGQGQDAQKGSMYHVRLEGFERGKIHIYIYIFLKYIYIYIKHCWVPPSPH